MATRDSEFAQILDESLKDSQDFGLNGVSTSAQENLNIAQILFISSDWRRKNAARTAAHSYPRFAVQPGRQEKRIDVRNLSANQRAALENWRRHGASLGPSLSLRELQQAWRKILFAFHPDVNFGAASPVNFAQLGQDYRLLKEAFKSDQQAA